VVTRRRLLATAGGGLAGASGLLLSACGERSRSGGRTPDPVVLADGGVIYGLLELEQRAIGAYTAALPHLSGSARALGLHLLSQERGHAAELRKLLRGLLLPERSPRPGPRPPRLRGERDALRLASDVEQAAIAAYIDALPKLTLPVPRASAASILAAEAEHQVALERALGRRFATQAFVWGRA
jgi:rubrerythrin